MTTSTVKNVNIKHVNPVLCAPPERAVRYGRARGLIRGANIFLFNFTTKLPNPKKYGFSGLDPGRTGLSKTRGYL